MYFCLYLVKSLKDFVMVNPSFVQFILAYVMSHIADFGLLRCLYEVVSILSDFAFISKTTILCKFGIF